MIQVINRAFTILKTVSTQPERPWTISELRKILKINQTTCTNIVKSLVMEGYLEPHGEQKGYILGPMPYYLTRRGVYKKDLIETALPRMEELTQKIGETSILAVLKYGNKVILAKTEKDSYFRLNTELIEQQEAYSTATGRLLTAFLEQKERNRIIKDKGLPGPIWNGADTPEFLEELCRRIRKKGYVVAPSTGGELMGIAYPLLRKGRAEAALGVFLEAERFSGAHKTEILKSMADAARDISRRL